MTTPRHEDGGPRDPSARNAADRPTRRGSYVSAAEFLTATLVAMLVMLFVSAGSGQAPPRPSAVAVASPPTSRGGVPPVEQVTTPATIPGPIPSPIPAPIPSPIADPVTAPATIPSPTPSPTPGPTATQTRHPSQPWPAPPPDPTPSLPACRAGTGELTVVSFNIKSGHFGGGLHLEPIADAIASWDVDVVLLQEVDKFRYTSRRIDMPTWFGDRLGMYSAFGANVLRPGNSQYGTAILSRYPIVSSHNVLLPNRPGGQQRGLLRALIEPGGVPVSVYDTHFEHTSQRIRVDQARAVARILSADPLPKVVGGDFNAIPASEPMVITRRTVADTWTTVGAGMGWTVPSTSPRARIDYLLYAGLVPVRTDVPAVTASDHRPVRATYRYSSTGTEDCVPPGD